MSNEEEKRCPLCAEEMDWTDQQFKPCKCGYQICVWCWHHIIDMAEKEETEGRCPACRIVYEKEKIVAMQADCERMAGKSSNRKTKPPKAKPKTNEVKRDLTNVRVIQRKMAYVIGLPLSLADEHLLQRKEYFGQYGKVTKISLSRTAGGTIQQFVNDTCSVYITFSKEEEALRCIQSVHGFVLEDRILRASFGTAKYCHAWLKNMPCNNSACLYLHTLGADEDSFGKDEVAAVHTRSRVQEIVGAGNTGIKRAGSVLPPPVDDLYHSTPSLPDRSTIGSPACDAIHGSIDTLSSRDRVTGVPHKMTTFVDVVGRPNSSGPDKNGMVPDDPGVSHLSSELSSVTIGRDIHPDEPYSGPPLFRVSSTNLTGNGLYRSISNEPLREDQLLYDSQGLNDSGAVGQRACSHPSNTAIMSEDSSGSALIRKTQSLNDFSVNANPVHNHEEAASLLTNCINAVLSDASHEMTFQNSAKSDRIYRGSNSFSNEEIVEHLRRIEGDNQINDDENSARNVVKNSSVSNFMSDFDSCDSLVIRNGLSELLDEPDIFPISSWNSSGSDQSGYSFVNQDVYASQLPGTVLPDFGDKRDQYLSNPPYPATRTQNFAPPGFNMPSRDPPPGFSSCERTGSLPRPSSGGRLVTSSLPTNMLQQSSKGFNASVDCNDPAILSCGKPTNEGKTPGFGMRHGSTPQMNMFEDDASLWILLQQQNSAYQDSKFSQVFGAPQVPVTQDPPPSYTPHTMSGLNGLSSTPGLLNQHQNYHPSSIPQQKYSNGHISSNGNGYLHGMEEFRHKGDAEVERNEMLGGLNNYFAGYGGAFSSSGDIYSRVFGL